MNKRPKNLDVNQLAKCIVGVATGESEPEKEDDFEDKNKAAQEYGRLGGLKGGKARSEKLTPEERSEIARNAAKSRWKKQHQSS